MDFKVDEKRRKDNYGATGIYVRAVTAAGNWGSHDIGELDRDSLHAWLRSRGGENLWAENVVFLLLGHEPITALGYTQEVKP